MRESRIILAADELTLDQCLELVNMVGGRIYAAKVHIIMDQHGPSIVKRLLQAGAPRVWVDAKLHDIPNTAARRAEAILESGAYAVTVHASGEVKMMKAVVETGIRVYAVTVLTSLEEEQAHLVYGQPTKATVLYQARLAKLAGAHAVVCSPKEVGMLAQQPELQGLEFITPGVRPVGASTDDQKRVDTPTAAIMAGATYLVIGRPIIKAADPVAALQVLNEEVWRALEAKETKK